MCLEAKQFINKQRSNCIAMIIVNRPNSLSRDEYLNHYSDEFERSFDELNLKENIKIKVNQTENETEVPAPPIATLYAKHTQSFLDKYGSKYGINRSHFAMIPCLMYRNGYNHPQAMCYQNEKLLNMTHHDIMKSKQIVDTDFTCLKQYECARLCDGGICIIVASKRFIIENEDNIDISRCFRINGGGEYTNSWSHLSYLNGDYKNYAMFHAVKQCLIESGIGIRNRIRARDGIDGDVDIDTDIIKDEIDYFGLYDCYPIAFIFGLLSTGIVDIENLAEYLEKWYNDKNEHKNICTHGGLLGFGAPGYVPCGYNIVEGVQQMRFEVNKDRQISFDKEKKKGLKGLIVGNGAILQFGAAMIIEKYERDSDNLLIESKL